MTQMKPKPTIHFLYIDSDNDFSPRASFLGFAAAKYNE
jgi:hypothetical protein